MKYLITLIGGIVSGYVISALENKPLEEVLDDLSGKIESWTNVTKEFISKTVADVEGFDSDIIRVNIEAFIDRLLELADQFMEIEEFEDKISFLEEEIIKFTDQLAKKAELVKKLEKAKGK